MIHVSILPHIGYAFSVTYTNAHRLCAMSSHKLWPYVCVSFQMCYQCLSFSFFFYLLETFAVFLWFSLQLCTYIVSFFALTFHHYSLLLFHSKPFITKRPTTKNGDEFLLVGNVIKHIVNLKSECLLSLDILVIIFVCDNQNEFCAKKMRFYTEVKVELHAACVCMV